MMMVVIKEKETGRVAENVICERLTYVWKIAESINNNNQNYYAEVIGVSIITSTIISLIFILPEYFKIKKQIDKMFEKKLKEIR